MMDFGVVLQTDPPAARVIDLAKRAETLRLHARVDVRLPPAVGGAVRHLQPDPRRDAQARSSARWSRTPRRATGRSSPRCSRRSTRCTATARSAGSAAATRRCASSTASRCGSPSCARRSASSAACANGEAVEYKGTTLRLPWSPDEPPADLGRRLRPEGARARPARSATASSCSSPTRTSPRGASRPCAAAAEAAGRDPDAITICVAAPAYVTDGSDAARPRARPVPLVRRHGRQPRRRHRRPLRRRRRGGARRR